MLGMSVLSQLVIILMINEVCPQKHIFSFAINPTLKLVNAKRMKNRKSSWCNEIDDPQKNKAFAQNSIKALY